MADDFTESHPTLLINVDATKDQLAEQIDFILIEVAAQLVVLQCALDSSHGTPSGEISSTFLHYLTRWLHVLQGHIDRALASK